MKTFLKSVLIVAICIVIFVGSGIRLSRIEKDARTQKYNSMAVRKTADDKVNNENTIIAETIAELEEKKQEAIQKEKQESVILLDVRNPIKVKQKDWRLVLVNYENTLPENFKIELANIDATRQFDARAIGELNDMLLTVKKAKIGDLWAQSAYRSLERQEELFSNRVNDYISKGKSKEEAELLTRQYINESNTSEHNLGLAVDFNYVNNDFEKTKVFAWLMEHAEDYGFILRYRKDKEEFTKVKYEPWHWRYVGVEHAKAINELDMCLEEYVQYIEEMD